MTASFLPRIPPLLLFLIAGGLLQLAEWLWPEWGVHIPGRWLWSTPLGIVALLIVLASAGLFRRAGTTVDPRDPSRSSALVTTGIYAISRNPMYLAFALALCSWSIVLGNATALVVVPAFVLILDRIQIPAEERALADQFGQDYARYRERVRRWL